jgi:hypothetical protein
MASILDAVLESMKAPTPASTEASSEKIENTREVITASVATALAEAGSSRATPVRLMEESLRENPHHLLPKHLPMVIWNTMFDTIWESSYH